MQLNRLGLTVLGLLLSNIQLIAAKSSNKGIEFVKACDSSADDVTNQCINRIPDDVGSSTGNHACAYHEAEVKCLGLCGNTLTWKVAYQNSLKRYRLVCAGYIDERIAEKEEEGEAEDDAPKKENKKKSSEAKAESEPDADAGDEEQEPKQTNKKSVEESSAKPSKSAQQKPTQKPSQSSSKQIPKSSAKPSKTSGSESESQSKPTEKQQSPKSKQPSDDNAKEEGSHANGGSEHNEKNPKDKSHAVLPSMDPELADSSDQTRALALASCLLVLVSTAAIAL
ncbi:hypothetical protein H4R24_004564 [Coemansia sp. RSA 988]|nr:hypothetical protein H4R24_004564 [Coemansia sp. RSA 988]